MEPSGAVISSKNLGAGAEASWLKREPAISRLCDKQFALVA